MMTRQHKSCQLLLLLWMLLLSCSSVFVSGKVRLTILRRYFYSAGTADFGFQFQEGQVHEADLTIPPPGDEFLCEYPESLSIVNTEKVVEFENPIALLVSQGRCSIDQKARVGLALQRNFSSAIKYIIVYNNEMSFANQVPKLTSDSVGEASDELDALGFLSVSTISGASLQGLIWWRSNSPHLTADGAQGALPVRMEAIPEDDPSSPSVSQRSGGGSNDQYFFLLRFVLFGIFICAPCLRAAYLWRAGGGRIGFRRNERGNVTGLRYVSPQPYWFVRAPNRNGEGQWNQDERLLTEEQVLEFPEIAFKPETQRDDVEKPCIPDLTASDEENPLPSTETASTTDTLEASSVPAGDASSEEYSTTCTVCSICIEDFEPNERIRVLPRCKHGFHTACLMPWLTERHAFCPLCKTSVLPEEEAEQDDEENQETQAAEDEQSQDNPSAEESAPQV